MSTNTYLLSVYEVMTSITSDNKSKDTPYWNNTPVGSLSFIL